MSTVIATHILGVASGPMPGNRLRDPCYMDLQESIGSGLRLRHKLSYVYWHGPSSNFQPSQPSIFRGSQMLKVDDITIVTLNGVQVGMVKDPLSFYHTAAKNPLVPDATLVSFVELLGPETSSNPKLSVEGVKALVSNASRDVQQRLSWDIIAFETIRDQDPFNRDSIFVHRFQWDWPRYQRIFPAVQQRRRSPLSASDPIGPESIAQMGLDATITSDVEHPANNAQDAADTARVTPRLDRLHENPWASRHNGLFPFLSTSL